MIGFDIFTDDTSSNLERCSTYPLKINVFKLSYLIYAVLSCS